MNKRQLLFLYVFHPTKTLIKLLKKEKLLDQAEDLRSKTEKYVDNKIKYILGEEKLTGRNGNETGCQFNGSLFYLWFISRNAFNLFNREVKK